MLEVAQSAIQTLGLPTVHVGLHVHMSTQMTGLGSLGTCNDMQNSTVSIVEIYTEFLLLLHCTVNACVTLFLPCSDCANVPFWYTGVKTSRSAGSSR